MSDALDRIRARVEAHTAAAPPFPPATSAPQAPANPPPAPVAPPTTDLAGQVNDLNELVASLSDRVGALEDAAVEDALGEVDAWGADPMMAALPEAYAPSEA